MGAYLMKSDASEGFNPIINFLNGSYIKMQALVDKTRMVVTEAAIRELLHLDDAKGVDCYPTRRFLQSLLEWDTRSHPLSSCFIKPSSRASGSDLSIHTIKYTFPALTQKVFANMRRVGNMFSGVETPLFEGMLVEQEIKEEGDADEH
nr:hypothetical protein [Tanacetum cinerariifolium]